MRENILVTGGAGFLGSHLCRELLKLNFSIICMDNLFTGEIRNINTLMNNPRFKFLEHDVTIQKDIECSHIFHLACPASPVHYQKDPVKTVSTNVVGTLNMLELAKLKKIPILFTSTSEVYGDPEVSPQKEDYWGRVNPIGIRSCYDEGKRCAETLCFDFHRQYNLEIKVIRIFNTYGPGMNINDGRVISNFIVQALKQLPLTIYGKGSQSRSLCYVSDLINGLIKFSNIDSTFTGPVNLGQNYEITMFELANKIISLTNSKSKIEYHSLPENDPKQRNPDLELARNTINWHPKIDLDQGLIKTIKYFRDLISI